MSPVCSKAHIITFLGPVGVGKSTQIRLLEDHFKSENIRVVKTFIKSSHGFAHILGRSLLALGVYEEVLYPDGLTRMYPRRDVVRKLFPLWSFLDMLSIAIKFFFTVYIPFSLGFTILIEEGLLMTLHTYLISFPRFFNLEPKVLPYIPQLICWTMRKNHVNVVLNATDEELRKRRRQRNYTQYEMPEYVHSQKKWIEHLNCGDIVFVDTTNKPVMKVHNQIATALEKRAP
jgi:hypothetical protein